MYKLNVTFLGLSATSSSLLCCAPSDCDGFESEDAVASSESDGFVGLRCLSSDRERSFVDSITVGDNFL